MFTFATFATVAAISALPANADQQSDRASLLGAWVQNGGNHAWVIDRKADGLHMTQIEGSAPVADFDCNTMGQTCDIKIAGHKATVQMYYDGAALVQLETRDGKIVQRRFSVLPSVNEMKVEVTPMTGHIQVEALEFERKQ